MPLVEDGRNNHDLLSQDTGDGGDIDGGSTGTWFRRKTRLPGRIVIRQAVRGEADRPLLSPLGTTA